MANEIAIFTGVVTSSTDLTVTDIPVEPTLSEEEVETLREKERRLEEAVAKTKKELDNITEDIRMMDQGLQHGAQELVQVLRDLQMEERILLDEQTAKAFGATDDESDEDDSDDPFKEHNDEHDAEEREEEEAEKALEEHENRAARRAKKKKFKTPLDEVKYFFRMIAQLTHPDKTNNRRMHAIFIRAKEAKENWDIPALHLLYKEASTPQCDFINLLLVRVETLERKLQELRIDQMELAVSDSFRMLKDWKQFEKRYNVQDHFNELVRKNIDGMKTKIRALDPTRYPLENTFVARRSFNADEPAAPIPRPAGRRIFNPFDEDDLDALDP